MLFTIPIDPFRIAINRKFMPGQRYLVVSPTYRAAQREIVLLIRSKMNASGYEPILGPAIVNVTTTWKDNRGGDFDATIKGVVDALADAGAIANDKNIPYGELRRVIDRDNVGITIEVKPAEGLFGPAPKPAKKGKPKMARVEPASDVAEAFLALLRDAAKTVGMLGPRKLSAGMRDQLAKLHAECEPTVEDIRHVVEVRRRMTERGEEFGSLTWDSICVPGNFRRWLATPLEQARTPSKSAPFGIHPQKGTPYKSAQDRDEWERIFAAQKRRRDAGVL